MFDMYFIFTTVFSEVDYRAHKITLCKLFQKTIYLFASVSKNSNTMKKLFKLNECSSIKKP